MFDIIDLQHFHLLRPYWLLILIPLAVIVRAFSLQNDPLTLWKKLMSAEILQQLTIKGNIRDWISPTNLLAVLAIISCIILVGPTWQQQPSLFSEDKSALIIALDVSQSMDQNDIQPSRLLRAKQKILELLALRGDSNTALIAYAGSAHIVMPISKDREMIRHFIDSLDHHIIPKLGKLPQSVLPLTEQLLQTTQVSGSLVIVGDGATDETIASFSRYFNNKQHQLIVWAMGKPVQTLDSAKKSPEIIPMQLTKLAELAENSNGTLVVMSHDKKDVNRVNKLVTNNLILSDDNSQPWYDAGYPLVFLIAAVFLFWFRRGWTLQW